MKLLVNAGADVEISNKWGHTCLMVSSYKGYKNIVEYLLAHGANVDRTNFLGTNKLTVSIFFNIFRGTNFFVWSFTLAELLYLKFPQSFVKVASLAFNYDKI